METIQGLAYVAGGGSMGGGLVLGIPSAAVTAFGAYLCFTCVTLYDLLEFMGLLLGMGLLSLGGTGMAVAAFLLLLGMGLTAGGKLASTA